MIKTLAARAALATVGALVATLVTVYSVSPNGLVENVWPEEQQVHELTITY